MDEWNSACPERSYLDARKGHTSVIASLRGSLLTIALALLACSFPSQAQPEVTRTAKIDLHTNAESRVRAQTEFDAAGRLLILYRDKYSVNPAGNWHLIRLTAPFSGKPKREQIDFSIPQEPSDPVPSSRWTTFSVRLLLSPDGSHAFAAFGGAIVTAKPGPPPRGAARNVSINVFESLVSFDLTAFRLSASADVTQHRNKLANIQISSNGELLRLYLTDAEWKISVLDEFLHEVRTVTVSAAPVDQSSRRWCELRSDLKIECPVKGRGNLLLSSDSVVQLAPSTCSMTAGRSAFGVGKDNKYNKYYVTEADRLCTRDESGNENLVSADLLPRCIGGWVVAAISPDRNSILTSCIVTEYAFDSFSYISRASLQLIDAPTLAMKATIPLSIHHRSQLAVFHHSGTSTIAVLEDDNKLLIYTVAD